METRVTPSVVEEPVSGLDSSTQVLMQENLNIKVLERVGTLAHLVCLVIVRIPLSVLDAVIAGARWCSLGVWKWGAEHILR